MRIGQTSIIFFVSKVLASVLGFLATVYFTRALGEEIYGFYVITIALVSWFGIIKTVGFGKAIVKRMSEGEEPHQYLFAGAVIKLTLTIPVISIILIFQEKINQYVGAEVGILMTFLLVISVLSELVNSALKGSHKVHIYAPLHTVKQAARSLLMIVLVVVGWELTGMLVGHAAGSAFVALIGMLIVHPKIVLPNRYHFSRLFDFAKYSWLGNIRGRAFNEMDILVLGLFVPVGLTGIYAVAYSLAKFLNLFGSAIKTALFPEMSKLSVQDDMHMIGTLTNDALTFAGLFLIPGVVGAAILGDRLMLVYGPNFDAGHWILVLLIVALIVYTYTKQLLSTLNAIDRPDLAFRANGAFIVANLLLNVLLVWQLGWFGAATATVLSAAVGFVLSLYYVRGFIDIQLPIAEVSRQWAAAILMGALVYLARQFGEANWQWIADYNAFFVVLLVSLGAGIYFATYFAISSTFRTTISRNLPFDVPYAR